MASVNKVILVGNVGRQVESRTLPNGDSVANFSLATTDSWRDKSSGERREATEWHRLVAYRKTADICSQYVKKGSQLYIEGRLKSRKWQDKDGQERTTTEIEVLELKMLGSRNAGSDDSGDGSEGRSYGGGGGTGQPSAAPAKAKPSFDDMDDDIPFATSTMAYDVTLNKAFGKVRRSV